MISAIVQFWASAFVFGIVGFFALVSACIFIGAKEIYPAWWLRARIMTAPVIVISVIALAWLAFFVG